MLWGGWAREGCWVGGVGGELGGVGGCGRGGGRGRGDLPSARTHFPRAHLLPGVCLSAQERIRIPDEKMEYYKDLAEM